MMPARRQGLTTTEMMTAAAAVLMALGMVAGAFLIAPGRESEPAGSVPAASPPVDVQRSSSPPTVSSTAPARSPAIEKPPAEPTPAVEDPREPDTSEFGRALAEAEALEQEAQFYEALQKVWALEKQEGLTAEQKGSLRALGRRLQQERTRAATLVGVWDGLTSDHEAVREQAQAKLRNAGEVGLIYLRKAVREKEGAVLLEAAKHLIAAADPQAPALFMNRLCENGEAAHAPLLRQALADMIAAADPEKRASLRKPLARAYAAVQGDAQMTRTDLADLLLLALDTWFNRQAAAFGAFLQVPDAYGALKKYVERARVSGEEAVHVWGLRQGAYFGLADVRDGLVGWWPLGDGQGLEVKDQSGKNAHGRIEGGASWKPGGLLVNPARGDAYVELPNSETLRDVQNGAYTLAVWFCPLSIPAGTGGDNNAHYALLAKAGYHTGLWYTREQTFALGHWLDGDKSASASSKAASGPESFWHVVGVVDRDAGEMRLYVNGEPAGSGSFAAKAKTRAYGDAPWRIGVANPGADSYRWAAHGILADVRIYSKALDPDTVRGLYFITKAERGAGGARK